MDLEKETNLTTIKVEGKDESYYLLKDILEKCKNFVKEICVEHKEKTLHDFTKIVSNIETCSELNYYFLKYMKEKNISYEEDGEDWDYKSNLNMLKETLTDEHFKLLDEEKRVNPLEEIIAILKEFLLNINNKVKNGYKNLVSKYPICFTKLNFPLVTGIERLRLKYYRDLIIEKDLSNICGRISSYINIIEKDKELLNSSLNDYKFNPKIYLLILILTVTFNPHNSKLICNFFTKNINDDDNNGDYKNVKPLEDGKYLVRTELEEKTINGDDYILIGIEKDIINYPCYPLEILLLRNESYQKFVKDEEKGFIHQLKLYDSFISYIKYFIKSNALKQALKNNDSYENIEILLNNDNYINEMLDETHFKFLPFYGSKNKFGYTNKDLMISFINSIPEIVQNAIVEVNYKEDEIKNLTNICLLLSIGVKFITSLNEFVIHLTYGYLYFFSNKKIDSKSFKEGIDKDGGFTFERQLNSGKAFDYLNINSAIVLLDGVSCKKNLSDFQNDLNSEINFEILKRRIKEGKIEGFLKDFLNKYPINFDFIEKNEINLRISLRGSSDIGIFINRDEIDTYGGGKAIKK